MKKLCLLLMLSALLLSTACDGKEQAGAVSKEINESSAVTESYSSVAAESESESSETTVSSLPAESEESVETTEESESSEVTEETVSSAETESFEENESIPLPESSVQEQPAESTAPVVSEKEPETIPRLFLSPQPEGEYHILAVGETLQLYSQIEGSELEDAMLLWTVSDPSVITLSAKKVTAVGEGIATVTLSYSNGLMPVSVAFKVVAQESEAS